MPTDEKSNEKTPESKLKVDRVEGRTTQTSEKQKFFFLAKFDSEDISYQERLPKTFNDLEALLNKILINLEETEHVFRNQAKEILDRDLAIHNYRSKLKKLEECLEEKRRGHERIDQSMQFVFRLGAEISNTLAGIEKDLTDSPQLMNGRKYTPERMSMYDTMLNLNVGQREMLEKISDSILSVNDLTDFNPCDPIEQFTRILSLHMETLKIIESKVKQMEEDLRALKALHEFYTNVKNPTVITDYY